MSVSGVNRKPLGKKSGSKKKANKTEIIFDEVGRRNYLMGFRKRKNERRQKAQKQIQLELIQEKKKAK